MAEGNEDKSSKTQQASEQKLKKAREKGDVPISKEVGQILAYFAILAVVLIFAPRAVGGLASELGQIFDMAPHITADYGEAGISDIAKTIWPLLSATAYFAGMCLLLLFTAGILSAVFQGPLVFSRERIKVKPSKLNPLKGFTRIVSGQNLFEFVKSLVKLTALVMVAFWVMWQLLGQLVPGGITNAEDIPAIIADQAATLLIWICVIMIPVVAIDFTFKRLTYTQKQMMSMKELKDEHKDSEGDPMIKSKRHQLRQRRARQRVLNAVPKATFIVTNPTHFAVALRYERGVDQAPVCVAKGADLMAHKIREIAHEHEVPVIECVPLARALYAKVEIDQTLPETYWEQVAALVSFVYDLKRKVRRKPPAGTALRLD